jgi:hydroxymethylpyrimidine/phosphomethylpyrimidine kinase
LVLGDTALSAAMMAKRYVAEAIRMAQPMGKGIGPVNHLWPLREE